MECLFIPINWNGVTVLLCNSLLSLEDPDDGVAPPVIAILQVDDQLLKTTLRHKEATTLLDSSYHIKGGEVMDPLGIRNEDVVEGLEAQDYMPIPCHQLRRGHSVMA